MFPIRLRAATNDAGGGEGIYVAQRNSKTSFPKNLRGDWFVEKSHRTISVERVCSYGGVRPTE